MTVRELDWDDPLGDIREAVKSVLGLLDKIQGLLPTASEEDCPPEGWAEAIYEMYLAKSAAGETFDLLEKVVTPMLRQDVPFTLPSGAILERKRGAKKTQWQHQALAEEVARRIVDSSVDFETGDFRRSVPEMVQSLMEYVGVQYWKVKNLSKIGIDPNQYCKSESGDDSIIVRRPN